jgi:hypothetical protein
LVEISGHELWWPERGYGVQLNLRIYVYDVEEIEGLRELVSGRDHSIAASSCMKGQWGTQVSIFFVSAVCLSFWAGLLTFFMILVTPENWKLNECTWSPILNLQ